MPYLVYKKQKWKDRQVFKYSMPRSTKEFLNLLLNSKPRAFKKDEFVENLIRSKENPRPVKLTFVGKKKFSLQATKVRGGTELVVITESKEVKIDLDNYNQIEVFVN